MGVTKTLQFVAIFSLLTIAAGACVGLNGKKMNDKQPDPSCDDSAKMSERVDSSKMNEIADTTGLKSYKIGNYLLFPEPGKIWVLGWYGTETKDCAGYFPAPDLKYGEYALVIIGGHVFFDTFDMNIDWRTVRIIDGNEYAFTFTDEQFWYCYNGGVVYKYDTNIPKPTLEENSGQASRDRNALAGNFRIAGRVLYCGDMPVLESFDVKNLRAIRSAGGFETDFITDGKKVLYTQIYGCGIEERNGKEYASIKEQIVEGVDLASLRVLGKEILADKNALYYQASVTPLSELKGQRLILGEW